MGSKTFKNYYDLINPIRLDRLWLEPLRNSKMSLLLGQPNSAYPESYPREKGMRYGVADGSRTRYLRSHNPVLYLVSYSHHQEAQAESLPH